MVTTSLGFREVYKGFLFFRLPLGEQQSIPSYQHSNYPSMYPVFQHGFNDLKCWISSCSTNFWVVNLATHISVVAGFTYFWNFHTDFFGEEHHPFWPSHIFQRGWLVQPPTRYLLSLYLIPCFWETLFPSKIEWDRIPTDLTKGSCDRAIRYSGFFGVRGPWVLLESSWIISFWPQKEPRKTLYYAPLFWLVNSDPYNGLL